MPALSKIRIERLSFLSLSIVIPATAAINLFQYWWTNPLYGYGLWVPPLALFLMWRERNRAIAMGAGAPSANRWLWISAAAIIAYLAMVPLLRIVQIANPDWRLLDWLLGGGAVLSLLCLTYRAGGMPWLSVLWYPLVFLLTAIPWPVSTENYFTQAAVPFVARTASNLLWFVNVPVMDLPRAILTAVGPVDVADECGGIRSFQIALMASFFWAGYFRLRSWRWAALLFLGLTGATATNILRICGLVLAAVWSGDLKVIDSAHDAAALMAQVLLMALIPALGAFLKKSSGTRARSGDAQLRFDDTLRCIPTRVAIASLVWLVISEVGARAWFRFHEQPGMMETSGFTVHADRALPKLATLEIPENVRRNYRYSEGLDFTFADQNGAPWTLVWLGFGPGDISACTHNVHRPDVCLPTAEYLLVGNYSDLDVKVGDRTIPFRHQFFRRGREYLHLFYSNVEVSRAAGMPRTDWTYAGRMKAALLGVRSHRSDMIHLSVAYPYEPGPCRQLAVAYLAKILRPETAGVAATAN